MMLKTSVSVPPKPETILAGSSAEMLGYTVATGVMAADARASRAAKVEPVVVDEIVDEKSDEIVVPPPAANPAPGPVVR